MTVNIKKIERKKVYPIWNPHDFGSRVWMVKGALGAEFCRVLIQRDDLNLVVVLFHKAADCQPGKMRQLTSNMSR